VIFSLHNNNNDNNNNNKCHSLCGSEVTGKIKQLEVEGGTCRSAP